MEICPRYRAGGVSGREIIIQCANKSICQFKDDCLSVNWLIVVLNNCLISLDNL